MAARPDLRLAILLIALAAGGVLAGGCGSSAGDTQAPEISSRVANVAPASAPGTESGEVGRVRDAVLGGLRRDFAEGTGVGGPSFESCLEGRLREALDRPTLDRLVGVYRRPWGQHYSAQALNILAEPLAARCGHRYYVPEMVAASRGLRSGKLAGAAARKLGVTYGPYLGVRCRRAGRIGCDRVGIDIVFRRRATAVVAVVDGRHLSLRTPGMHSGVRDHDWVGTLAGAGMNRKGSPFAIEDAYGPRRWSGYPPVYVPIEFRVAYADGTRARALFAHVFLSPGWG